MKSVQQGSSRYQSGMSGAGQAYEAGVSGTTVDVMGKAIAASGAAVSNYTSAITSGRWAAAINASGGTANWKAKTQAKSGNYTASASYASSNYGAAAQKLYPAIESIVNGLPARQPGNVAANVQNRVLGLAQALHAAKGQYKA